MYELLKELCRERGTTISKLCTEVTGNSANLATWKKGYMRSDYLSKCADVLGIKAAVYNKSFDHCLGQNKF